MKAIKYLLLAIVILFSSFTIWMITLPSVYSIERQITINTPIQVVFDYSSNLTHFEKWATWFQSEEVALTVSSPATGSGAFVSFLAENGTTGKFIFEKVLVNTAIDYSILYNDNQASNGAFSYETEGEYTSIRWSFEGYMPFYFRWVIIGMDRKVGGDLEQSLQLLKTQIEALNASDSND